MSLLPRVQHITAACLTPVIPIYGSHFEGSKVTPPEEGPSQPLKATQDTRGPEEELGKSREELRVIHDNHSGIATRAHKDECNDENYNTQQGAKGYKCHQANGPSSALQDL